MMRPQWISMQHERKANLDLLAFNRDVVKPIRLDDFVVFFCEQQTQLTAYVVAELLLGEFV